MPTRSPIVYRRGSTPGPTSSSCHPSAAARIRAPISTTCWRCSVSSPDREATINELFARLSAHEWEDAGLLTADDVEFELAYAPEFMDMPVRGRAALVNLYASILGPMFDGFTIAPDEIILGADPDVAVVTYASDATVKHNGKPDR